MLKKQLKHFSYFYSYLGIKIFIGLSISILVGILDGVGLALFLPLLQMVDNSSSMSSDDMGNLQFVIDFITNLGFDINLNTVLVFILSIFILKGIAKLIEGYYTVYIQQSFIVQIRKKCLNLFNKYQYKSFIKSDPGRIQNTLSGEVVKNVSAYRNYFLTLQNIVLVIVYVFLAFLSNPQFAILVAVGGSLINIVFKKLYQSTKKRSVSLTNNSHIYQGQLIQSVAFFKYLQSTNVMKVFTQKLNSSIDKLEEDNKKIGFITSFITAVREPLILIIVVASIYIEINYLNQKLGLIILSLLFFYRGLNFLMMMQTTWNEFLSNSGSLENMDSFIKELENSKTKYGKEKFNGFSKNIELKNIYFSFSKDDYILHNINLSIKKNETIAFVGLSGGGKTTLINLISGLYSPKSGDYFIDNVSTNNYDFRTIQSKIGYITQEPVVFNDTIFNNITLWDTPTPKNIKRFWESLEKASIKEFVLELDNKENSYLGNNGINISGGQKQRLSIARELYKDIEILILDEATSALDYETEKIIQNNLENLHGQYTMLIIAHRLSSIKNADNIVYMEKGKIISIDTFENLKRNNKKFKNMIDLQNM